MKKKNFPLYLAHEGSISQSFRGKSNLWFQVVDETGKEVFFHNKPENYPSGYSVSELIALHTSMKESGNTVFVKSFEDSGKTWNYLVGFPYAIGKYTLYYNGENVGRLFPVFRTGISMAVVLLFRANRGKGRNLRFFFLSHSHEKV